MKTVLITFSLVCFGLVQNTRAISPPPDGCYPAVTTAEGCNALAGLTSGQANTGLGWFALFSAGNSNFNTAVGAGTLVFNTGDSNTAIGTAALLFNTAAADNTAVGTSALLNNDSSGNGTAQFNTAVGSETLQANVDGTENTAVGFQALSSNLASRLTAVGTSALFANINATANTAIGDGTLVNNDAMGHGVANDNTAVGFTALSQNFEGANNTAVGSQALALSDANGNGLANGNTAVGAAALASNLDGAGNTAVGAGALGTSSGSNNTAVGRQAGLTSGAGSNNVYLGSDMAGVADENDHTYIRNINTTPLSGGGTEIVTVNVATGLLGHLSSSRRYKEEIQLMNDASETLYRLKPVTFRYKKEIDASQVLDYGLIAEDVADVDADLVVRDKNGQVESVRYTAVNAMLLNEFLKAHRQIDAQQKQIEALTAGLQKVSAQIELSKPAPQTVMNKHKVSAW